MRILSHEDLKAEKGIKYSAYHLRRLENDKRFPKRLHLGGRVAWVEEEVDDWIREKMEARNI